jgi:hypothetical protein
VLTYYSRYSSLGMRCLCTCQDVLTSNSLFNSVGTVSKNMAYIYIYIYIYISQDTPTGKQCLYTLIRSAMKTVLLEHWCLSISQVSLTVLSLY